MKGNDYPPYVMWVTSVVMVIALFGAVVVGGMMVAGDGCQLTTLPNCGLTIANATILSVALDLEKTREGANGNETAAIGSVWALENRWDGCVLFRARSDDVRRWVDKHGTNSTLLVAVDMFLGSGYCSAPDFAVPPASSTSVTAGAAMCAVGCGGLALVGGAVFRIVCERRRLAKEYKANEDAQARYEALNHL